MNLAAIRKNYDKLTHDERFSLLTAAKVRDDTQERAAILAATPRKRWDVPTTRGLGDAWETLSYFHVIMQLGYIASLYSLLFYEVDELAINDRGEKIKQDDALLLIQRRMITSREAWRAVCKDYGVDPAAMIEGLPFSEMIDINELIIAAANDGKIETLDLQENIDALKGAIETLRKDWE
jgi:hypothetical protein